jgi:RNA polymerase sigma-70 factor, ECF subfamily
MIEGEARGAWRELETRLRPYVARRVRSACDVDDVVQDVFVKIHRGLGELRDGESFGAWVYRIAERAVVDHARTRARHPLSHDTSPVVDEPSPQPDTDDLQAALTGCVALFVGRLPSPYREAVTLTELQGMTQQAAADALGISLSGMKSRVQRGRQQIRRMFEQCCEIAVDARGHVVECVPRALADVPDDCRDAAAAWDARRKA